MTTPNSTPAGWYDDGSGRQRWWDGQQWGIFADEFSAQASTTDDSASVDASSTDGADASATNTSAGNDAPASDTSAWAAPSDASATTSANDAAPSYDAPSDAATQNDAPAHDAPAADASGAPSYDASATPSYEAPGTETPAYEPPATETPAYESPVAPAPPAYEATQPPAYEAPSSPEAPSFTVPGASASDAPAYAGAPAYQAPGAANPYGTPGTPGTPNQAYPGAAPSYPGSGAPAYPGAYGAAPAGPKKLNIVALISAIVAAVGFIFACIPGALFIGWILLPIAFVLSIVSLFLKGDKKWLGFVGLGLSILGTIAGFIVFFAVLANSFDQAFNGNDDTTVTQPSDEPEDEGSTDEGTTEEDPSAAQGSRENPYPLGSEISNSDWTVVVNSVNPDGNAVVSAANQFNEPAPAGSHYEIVNLTVTYKGADSSYAAEVMVDAVLSSGSVVSSYDALVVLEDDLGYDELYAGGTVTGSIAFLVPDGDTYLLRVTPGILADDVFIKP